jgi:hypothetical protein
MRAECCKAARQIVDEQPLNETDLEECALLDEALASAHLRLKQVVRDLMLARLRRRSRGNPRR